jgi:hypothetical protein
MNNQKNTKIMRALLIVTKVVITTVAAFINPWLVVPTVVTLELMITKFANKIYPIEGNDRDSNVPLNFDQSKESGIAPKRNVRGKQPHTNVVRKRNVKFSKTTPQARSSKPKATKGDQI